MEKDKIKVTTFKDEFSQANLQIENARKLPLESTIGNLFKVEDAEVLDGKIIYSVRTLNSSKMPVGSLLAVSVKGSNSVFNKKMALQSLTGAQSYVVRFENLGHWLMATKSGLREGLSASSAELVNVSMKDVIDIASGN